MTSFLDQLERELVASVQRHAQPAPSAAPWVSKTARSASPAKATGSRDVRWWQTRISVRLLLAAVLVALVLATAALAATGVLFTGAPVPATPHLSAHAGLGLPEAGHSRLALQKAPDPKGGPPWTMRILQTTRGLVCLQVGRLHDRQVGVLGEDGAFHDDGLFHPLPARTLESNPRRYATTCEPEGVSFSEEVSGMPQSAQLPRSGTLGRPAEERRLLYGLLGPSAVSVTYEAGARVRTVAVEPGTGAYLIVLPGESPSPKAVKTAATMGLRSRQEGRLRAESPLVTIDYRVHGRQCVEGGLQPVAKDACPRESSAALRRRLLALESPLRLHQPISVRLQPMPTGWWRLPGFTRRRPAAPPVGAVGGVYYEAWIDFKAPYGVSGAGSGYSIATLVIGKGGMGISPIERNVRKGATVHSLVEDVFANSDGRTVKIEVLYHALRGPHRNVVVGEATLRSP